MCMHVQVGESFALRAVYMLSYDLIESPKNTEEEMEITEYSSHPAADEEVI